MDSLQQPSTKGFHRNEIPKNMHELYGLNLDQTFTDRLKKQAKSVAVMVLHNSLIYHPNDDTCTWDSNYVRTLNENIQNHPDYGHPLADNENYRDVLAPGFGTAFLVSEKIQH